MSSRRRSRQKSRDHRNHFSPFSLERVVDVVVADEFNMIYRVWNRIFCLCSLCFRKYRYAVIFWFIRLRKRNEEMARFKMPEGIYHFFFCPRFALSLLRSRYFCFDFIFVLSHIVSFEFWFKKRRKSSLFDLLLLRFDAIERISWNIFVRIRRGTKTEKSKMHSIWSRVLINNNVNWNRYLLLIYEIYERAHPVVMPSLRLFDTQNVNR